MGTHPIFESDFDCLTDKMPDRVGGQGSRSSALSKPVDYVTGIFWSLINFVVVFFSTMLGQNPPTAQNRGGRTTGRSGGSGWGNGGGPGGGSGGGGKNIRGMNDVNPKAGPKMNVGGGG